MSGDTFAAAEEIEVTPEMIEAGMREYGARWLGLRDADDDIAREMLTAAYRAMFRSQPLSYREARRTDLRALGSRD